MEEDKGENRKRRRVAFEEPDGNAVKNGEGSGALGAGAAKRNPVRGRGQAKANRSDNNSGGAAGAENSVDYFDDAEGENEFVEEEVDKDYDNDDDEGNEAEEAAGGGDFGSRDKAKSAGGGGDEDDENEGGGGTKVKKLKKVKGEVNKLDEEFNEAGEAFEPFNLRSERDEGFFDASGNYHWKKKTAEDYDPWLEELDAMDPKERKRLQETAARTTGTSAGEGDDDDDEEDGGGKGGDDDENLPPEAEAEDLPATTRVAHLTKLYEHVTDGETVAAVLRRLGAASRAAVKAAGKGSAEPPKEKVEFEAVTDAADALLTNGMVDVYTANRRTLLLELNDARDDAGLPPIREAVAAVAEAPAAAATAAPSSSSSSAAAAALPAYDSVDKRWQYKWSLDAGAESYGPFTSAEMAAWKAAGYFAAGTLYVKDLKAADAPSSSSSAAAAPTAGDALDDDDDIFGGVGKYKAPAEEWKPLDAVQF